MASPAAKRNVYSERRVNETGPPLLKVTVQRFAWIQYLDQWLKTVEGRGLQQDVRKLRESLAKIHPTVAWVKKRSSAIRPWTSKQSTAHVRSPVFGRERSKGSLGVNCGVQQALPVGNDLGLPTKARSCHGIEGARASLSVEETKTFLKVRCRPMYGTLLVSAGHHWKCAPANTWAQVQDACWSVGKPSA